VGSTGITSKTLASRSARILEVSMKMGRKFHRSNVKELNLYAKRVKNARRQSDHAHPVDIVRHSSRNGSGDNSVGMSSLGDSLACHAGSDIPLRDTSCQEAGMSTIVGLSLCKADPAGPCDYEVSTPKAPKSYSPRGLPDSPPIDIVY